MEKLERIFSKAVGAIDKIYMKFREIDLTIEWNDDIIDFGDNIQTVLEAFDIMNYPSNTNYEKALVRLQVIKKQLVQEAKRRWIYDGPFKGIV